MDRYAIINRFFHAIEKLDHDEIMKFFEPNATVHSPLYGNKSASTFYKEFIGNTNSMKFEVKNFFENNDHPNVCAAHIIFSWQPTVGSLIQAECVNIFTFKLLTEKIEEATIIYDTVVSRPLYEKMHK